MTVMDNRDGGGGGKEEKEEAAITLPSIVYAIVATGQADGPGRA